MRVGESVRICANLGESHTSPRARQPRGRTSPGCRPAARRGTGQSLRRATQTLVGCARGGDEGGGEGGGGDGGGGGREGEGDVVGGGGRDLDWPAALERDGA